MACGTADVLIWNVLHDSNCQYRRKAQDQLFCRSEDNATGLCDKKSCPLANSQYATTRLIAGKIYLQMKAPERVHMPAKTWQRIELSENVAEAMDVIENELQYWDEWQIEKVKQRYVRLLEILQNIREMRKAPKVRELPILPKVEKRNKSREKRALNVAHVEYYVKEELLKRLREGEYGEIYNVNQEEFDKALDEYAEEVEFIDESDLEEFEYEEEAAELA